MCDTVYTINKQHCPVSCWKLHLKNRGVKRVAVPPVQEGVHKSLFIRPII